VRDNDSKIVTARLAAAYKREAKMLRERAIPTQLELQ
jgi:hypothetical protein